MVRHEDAAAVPGKRLECREVLDRGVIALERGIQDMVIALGGAVPFIAQNRRERAGLVELMRQFHNFRPPRLGRY